VFKIVRKFAGRLSEITLNYNLIQGRRSVQAITKDYPGLGKG
jgi:hypothetical protein